MLFIYDEEKLFFIYSLESYVTTTVLMKPSCYNQGEGSITGISIFSIFFRSFLAEIVVYNEKLLTKPCKHRVP